MELAFAGAIVYYAYLLVGSVTLGYLLLRFSYPDIRAFPVNKKLGASAMLGGVLVVFAVAADYFVFGWDAVINANGFTIVFLFGFFILSLFALTLFFTMHKAPLLVGVQKPFEAPQMPGVEVLNPAGKQGEKVGEEKFRDILKPGAEEGHLRDLEGEVESIHDEMEREEEELVEVEEEEVEKKMGPESKSIHDKLEELRKAGLVLDHGKKREEAVPELKAPEEEPKEQEEIEAEQKAEQAAQELLAEKPEEEVLEIKPQEKPKKSWLEGIKSALPFGKQSSDSAEKIKEEVTGKPSKQALEAKKKELETALNTQDDLMLRDIVGEDKYGRGRETIEEKQGAESPVRRHRLYAAGEKTEKEADKDSEFGQLMREVYPDMLKEGAAAKPAEGKQLRRYEAARAKTTQKSGENNELEDLLTQMDQPKKPGAPKQAAKPAQESGVSVEDLFGNEKKQEKKTAPESSLFSELSAISSGEKKSVLPETKTQFTEVEKKPGRGCPTCGNQNARIIFCPYCGSGMCANCSPAVKPSSDGFVYVCPKCREEVAIKKGEK